MATRRWGISQGERFTDVTEAVGAAVVNNSVELTIDTAAITSKQDADNLIELIRIAVHESTSIPA